MTDKIYTKTGDDGRTGLFGGGRVDKDHVRVEAYGDVDELNAVIGSARSVDMMPRIDEVLAPVQRDLFAIGALLATPHPEKHKEQLEKARLSDLRIAQLEQAIDDGEAELESSRHLSCRVERQRPPPSMWRARSAAAPSAPSFAFGTPTRCRAW